MCVCVREFSQSCRTLRVEAIQKRSHDHQAHREPVHPNLHAANENTELVL